MRNFFIVALLIFLFSCNFSVGQTPVKSSTNVSLAGWVNMMEDPDANFYDIQKAFNKVWQKKENRMRREKRKQLATESHKEEEEMGGGLMTFRRWENFWKPRVYPSGLFPDPAITYHEFQKWKNIHGNPKNSGNGVQTVSNWSSLGPSSVPTNGGAGRINCIRFDPVNSNIMYAGAAAGGLWKSTTGGTSWSTTTDQLQVIGVSDVLIDPTNTNVMYLATGDGDAGDTYSIGVLKSTDGGATWNTTGLSWAVTQVRRISKLMMHPSNTNIILAATTNGVFKTTDGGATWSQKLAISAKDIEFNPADPTVVYVSGSAFYKSTNTGDSFSQITSGLPASGIQRIAIGVTANDATYVYLLISRSSDYGLQGIYRSTDSGTTFTAQATSPNLLGWNSNGGDSGGQGWYDLSIAVNPSNKNDVYIGGVNQWRSTNGGTSWNIISHWYGGGAPYVHADVHAIEFLPGSSTTLFSGNDGGVFKTANNGSSWADLSSGLAVAQMYRLSTSATNANLNLAGNQDNGSTRLSSGSWSEVLGGDGMECIIDYTNANIMYGEVYYGEIYKSTNGGGSFSNIVGSGGSGADEDGAWITPYILNPSVNTTMLVGKSQVYESTNSGTNWVTLGNISGGSGSIIALEYAPSNTNYIYAAKYNALFVTSDGGTNWTNVTTGLPTSSASITYIAVDAANAQRVWVTFSGYSNGNKVFYSNNAGSSWTNFSGSLPNIPVNCIVYQKNTTDAIYVGTDAGVYYRDATLTDWTGFMTNLPNVIVAELEIQYSSGKIRAATFGRGLWESPLSSNPTNSVATGNISPVVYCSGSAANIAYTATGTFIGGNVFTAQLSDATGSFSSPVTIGTITSTAISGTIASTIPLSTSSGTGYRIRVISSNPGVTGLDNGNNITVNARPTVSITTPAAVCAEAPTFQISAVATPGGSIRQIGTSTATTASGIFDASAGGMRSQILFTKAELNGSGMTAAGIIKSLGLLVGSKATAGSFVFQNFTISLQNTSLTSLTSTYISSGFTTVYTGNFSTVSNWNDFNFSTPFNWDGTSNLLINVCFNNGAASGGQDLVYTTTTSGSMRIYGQGTNLCSAASGTTTTNRPNVRFMFGTLTYSWSPATFLSGSSLLQPFFNPTVAGKYPYTLTVTDGNGCNNTANTTITVNASQTVNVSIAASATTVCAGTSVTFTANPTNGGATPAYQWKLNGSNVGTNGNTYSIPAPVNGSIVTCVLTSSISSCLSNNPDTSNAITLTVNSLPTITATSNSPVCAGNSLNFSSSGGTTYLWSGPNGFSSTLQNPVINNVLISATGIYTVLVTTTGGCSAASTTSVTVNVRPTATASSNSPLCSGSNLNLSSSGGTSYAWVGPNNFASTSQNPVIPNATTTATGTYTVIVSNSSGCTALATTAIIVNAKPTTTTNSNSPVCVSNSINLSSSGGNSYLWNGPNSFSSTVQNPIIPNATVASSGVYSITITDGNGCKGSSSTSVTINNCSSVLNITVFLQGYYTGINKMRATLYNHGLNADATATDSIEINLWSPAHLNNSTPDYSLKTILHTNGSASVTFPPAVIGKQYFVAIKHRNTLETWSHDAITFNNAINNYNFSSALSQAYNNGINSPMKNMGSNIFALFSGNINGDNTIDASDMAKVDNDNQLFVTGYVSSDCNGDGQVDLADMAIIDNNSNLFLFTARP